MAQPFEVTNEQREKFAAAMNFEDGSTAARMLEEVGSCGWASLIGGRGRYEKYGSHVTIDGDKETITAHRRTDQFTNKVATVSDKRCEKK